MFAIEIDNPSKENTIIETVKYLLVGGEVVLRALKNIRRGQVTLVENASSKKAPTENFITKFARYYTPAVVFSALALAILPPLFVEGATFSQWIYRALAFLVVSCPCALVISIPLGFFGGIGGASKNGILVKGGNYLEALNNVEIVVFDKTGTLTKGTFKVTEVKPQNNISKDELIGFAVYKEDKTEIQYDFSTKTSPKAPNKSSKIRNSLICRIYFFITHLYITNFFMISLRAFLTGELSGNFTIGFPSQSY